MKKETLTPTTIKQSNQSKIYQLIYQEKQISKQEIAKQTGISLPTIASSLNAFEEKNLIKRNETYASTGGRKAKVIACNPQVKVAIGVEIAASFITIVAIDVYGTVIAKYTTTILFINNDAYFKMVTHQITSFINDLTNQSILGIGIAIQGLISKDGTTVTYGEILKCTGLQIATFQQHLKYPCLFIHDAKAAATAELWVRKQQQDAMYLSLSRNLGGAIILNNKVYEGDFLPGGLFEHMLVVDQGKPCYCGKKGCLEAYCGANVLLQEYNTLDSFFLALSNQDVVALEIWHTYLHYLAIAIHNLTMVLGCHIILGGQLGEYLTEKDLVRLQQELTEISAFKVDSDSLTIAKCTNEAIAIGAALPFIKDFLQSI